METLEGLHGKGRLCAQGKGRLGLGSPRFPSWPTEESLACLVEHGPVDFLGSKFLSCGHWQILITSPGAAPPEDKPSAF